MVILFLLLSIFRLYYSSYIHRCFHVICGLYSMAYAFAAFELFLFVIIIVDCYLQSCSHPRLLSIPCCYHENTRHSPSIDTIEN